MGIDVIDYIERIREEKGMSIQSLCNNIVSNRTYTRYLSKNSHIPLTVFDQLLKRLSIPLYQFSIYMHNTILTENIEESYFVDSISNDNYDVAYTQYYDAIKKKPKLKSRRASKALPIALALLEGHRNIISKAEMHARVRKLVNFDVSEKRKTLYADELDVFMLFLKIASDEEKTRIADYLTPFLFHHKAEYKLFTRNVEGSQLILYQILLTALTKREHLRDQDHDTIKAVTDHFLAYHKRSKMNVFDVIIFETLYQYIKKHDIDNELVIFHFVASVLTQVESSVFDSSKYTFSDDDITVFLKYFKDEQFLEEPMYERLCAREYL